VAELPDWYLPYFPELRAGPPWVTEDMIAAEPGLARIVDDLAEPAAEVAEMVRDTWQEGKPVTVAGSGTSEYAAQAVAEIVDDALRTFGAPGGVVQARESFDSSLDPRPGFFLAVSHGGRSRVAVGALEAARAAGARTALITAAGSDTPVAAAADLRIDLPFADRSFCHTVGYLSPILVATAIGGALMGTQVDRLALEAHLEEAHETLPDARRIAASLHGVALHLTVGSGADAPSARELSLKIEEAVRVPAAMRGLETLQHGHLVPADSTTSAVVLVADRRQRERRAERAATALRACRRLGLRTALIATRDVIPAIDLELVTAGTVVIPDFEPAPAPVSALTATALALQQLTISLVHEAGVNPDLIRREEQPYREAAVLTEAKIR
jgi:glutamine---fructose-6-phosphate transaminase (isomerizing)